MKLLLHLYFLFYVVVCIYKQNLCASFISISFTINILKNSNSLELFDLNIILFFNIEKGDNYAFVFMSFHHMSNLCSLNSKMRITVHDYICFFHYIFIKPSAFKNIESYCVCCVCTLPVVSDPRDACVLTGSACCALRFQRR